MEEDTGSSVVTNASNQTHSKSMRLGMCEVCAAKEARYACPKCEVKTCCLTCVQIHKRELKCDGKRDRTKYVPLNEMTAREFMSDYCFLEECTRYADNRKSDPSKRFTQHQRILPVPQHRMRLAAHKRRTRLQFLLPNFSRHKENTTYLDWKLGRLYWRIEWLFVDPHVLGESPTVVRLIDERCDEELPLAALLKEYIDGHHDIPREQRKLLQNHQTAGLGQITTWLRAEGIRRCGSRCYALSMAQTLRENLGDKTILEFPTILVSYEATPPPGWTMVDSDDEDETSEIVNDSEKANATNKRLKVEEETQETPAPELQDIYEQLVKDFAADDSDDSEVNSDHDVES
ncbi:box C/D snoRNA protein 1 [Drosophila willistoni]|nr:box C/D snoRNA protein 1 [Drosophila willistoni]